MTDPNLKGRKKQSEEIQNSGIEKTAGFLLKDGVAVSTCGTLEDLTSRGYGTLKNKKLTLSFYEALFLQSKGLLEVYEEGSSQALIFQELLHRLENVDENIWVRYLIYRDLRSRGYVVREGFGLGIDFRVYERGEYGKATAAYLIRGIQEGKPASVKELAQVLKRVHSLKKKMVLAVINRRGEIVYYTISNLTMKKQ